VGAAQHRVDVHPALVPLALVGGRPRTVGRPPILSSSWGKGHG